MEKRPIANAVRGCDADPNPYDGGESYAAEHTRRQAEMRAEGPPMDEPDGPILASPGFTLSHDGFAEAGYARFGALGTDWWQMS